ncbi:MAG: hypothetical protein ACOY4K_01040 [Pseudomonadota bacterium]
MARAASLPIDLHSAVDRWQRDLVTRHVQLPLAIGLLLGGCLSGPGPDPSELASLLHIPASDIRALRCQEIPDEPTEFSCRYQRRGATGGWVAEEIIVAIDGSDWVVIDEPHPTDQP